MSKVWPEHPTSFRRARARTGAGVVEIQLKSDGMPGLQTIPIRRLRGDVLCNEFRKFPPIVISRPAGNNRSTPGGLVIEQTFDTKFFLIADS